MLNTEPAGINRRLDFTLTDALIRRFWPRVAKAGDDECWLWKAAYRNGYGAIKHENRVISAHRLAYVIANGFPDPELIIGHTCDVRGCCNPKHLEAITAKKNNADAKARVKFHPTVGEDMPNAVLTESLVREIRRLHEVEGLGVTKILRRLEKKLSRRTVEKAMRYETWKHVGASQ